MALDAPGIDPQTVKNVSEAQAALTGEKPAGVTGEFDFVKAARDQAARVRAGTQTKLGAMAQGAPLSDMGTVPGTPGPTPVTAGTATAAPTGIVAKGVAGAKKIGGATGGVLSALARVGGGAQAALGAGELATGGPSSNAVDNMFQGAATMVHPGIGIAGNALTSVRDMILPHVLNSLGLMPADESPLVAGNAMNAKAQADLKAGRIGPGALPPAKAAPTNAGTIPSSQGGVEAVNTPGGVHEAANTIANGVVQPGYGFVQNNQTGKVTKISPHKGYGAGGEPPAAPAGGATPDYGPAGAMFGNDFVGNLVKNIQANREQHMSFAREQMAQQLKIKSAEIQRAALHPTGGMDWTGKPYAMITNTLTGETSLQHPKETKPLDTNPANVQSTFEAYVKKHNIDREAAKQHLSSQGYDVSQVR